MKTSVLLALAAVGCAPRSPAVSLDDAKASAMQAWQEATGGRFPALAVELIATDATFGRAASTSVSDAGARILVNSALPPVMARRMMLHELGHAAGLVLDPGSGDPSHWHGWAPSVMRKDIEDAADEIGQPELAAFDRKFGR